MKRIKRMERAVAALGARCCDFTILGELWRRQVNDEAVHTCRSSRERQMGTELALRGIVFENGGGSSLLVVVIGGTQLWW